MSGVADYAIPYGMREIVITPYSDAAATTLGTPVPLPIGQTMSFTEGETTANLRGDDKVYASRGGGPEVTWDLTAGGIDLEAYAALNGGTVATSGTSPAEVKTYSKKFSDARPYFKAEGRAISDNGGDFHTILWKCKCTSIDGSLQDQTFYLTNASGEAFASTETSSLDKVYEHVHNETATAI